MIHRYAAGILGLLVLIAATYIFINKTYRNIYLAYILLLCVIGQGLLGMLTVTMKLYPVVVAAHLLGGMTILAISWLLTLIVINRTANAQTIATSCNNKKHWLLDTISTTTIIALFLQIALGAWTSANYAALVCADFPSCQGSLWPDMDWAKAFNLTAAGIFNSPGIPLENTARVTIQMAHRLGAILASTSIILLCVCCYKYTTQRHKFIARALVLLTISLLIAQISLGIANVLSRLPLVVAMHHNAIAACLLLAVITNIYYLRK